jgi:hypothetical protein
MFLTVIYLFKASNECKNVFRIVCLSYIIVIVILYWIIVVIKVS